jgi:hypothetical protein
MKTRGALPTRLNEDDEPNAVRAALGLINAHGLSVGYLRSVLHTNAPHPPPPRSPAAAEPPLGNGVVGWGCPPV